MGSRLHVSQLKKAFGPVESAHTLAIEDVSFDVDESEFLSIVGPSGCGKSTLLQIVAGLIPATSGAVHVDDRLVTEPPEGLVYVFQQYGRSLFPWRTTLENVMFAVQRKLGKAEAREHSREYLKKVGLQDFENHYPWQLSGGMQQRVVIARALAAQPKVLLLDEPFSSVDALTRIELHELILDLWTKHRFTAVLVTHDVDEAIYLADRVLVLSKRPTVALESIPTGIPRPRHPIESRETPEFLKLRHELLGRLLGANRNG